MALRLLAAGHVLQIFVEAKATLSDGTDPPLHAGEAEFAANLANTYEHRYLLVFRRAVIWKLLQNTWRA